MKLLVTLIISFIIIPLHATHATPAKYSCRIGSYFDGPIPCYSTYDRMEMDFYDRSFISEYLPLLNNSIVFHNYWPHSHSTQTVYMTKNASNIIATLDFMIVPGSYAMIFSVFNDVGENIVHSGKVCTKINS